MKKYQIVIFLIFLFTFDSYSQNSTKIFGKVLSKEDLKPIPNTIIALDYGSYYTYTNISDGSFLIYPNEKSKYLLVFINDSLVEKIKIDDNEKNYIIKIDKNKIPKENIYLSPYERMALKEKSEEAKDEKSTKDKKTPKDKKLPKDSKKIAFKKAKDGEYSEAFVGLASKTSSIIAGGGESSDFRPMEMGMPLPYDNNKTAASGLLTAGEVNDFSKWVMWNDLAEGDLSKYKDIWKFYPYKRYTLQINNEYKSPVFGAKVNLLVNGYSVWASVSDNTGKAELWINPFTNIEVSENNISLEIEYQGKYNYIDKPKKFSEGTNFLELKTSCIKPKSIDIAFVVDATGSMGDEIQYLKLDLQEIIKKINDTLPQLKINLGSVFYKDTTDDYLTVYSDFSQDIKVTSDFIADKSAGGGGDYPEAVHRGLDVAINKMSWTEESIAKIIFLVLDAPPHETPSVIAELQQLISKASEYGIRIIPLACSGVDKSTEYILRSMALLTNGTYTFLTDDSGIGNPHIKPSTDQYDVETLRDLLIRLVYQYSYYPNCFTEYPLLVNDTLDVKLPQTGADENDTNEEIEESNILKSFKYYPNPTFGPLIIELLGKAENLFISDISGKIIYKLDFGFNDYVNIDLSKFTSGVYYIMYEYKPDKWLKGKIILMH